jgi:dTDP-4-dehydrorhamnose reductase
VAPGGEVAAIGSGEYPQAAKRPANSVLDGTLARTELGVLDVGWETLLDECVAAYGSRR